MMIHQVAKKYNPSTLEKNIQELWDQKNAYEEVKQHCKNGE